MKLRARITLGYLLIMLLGFVWLADWALKDLRPHYLKSMEESLVDTATLLSSLLAASNRGDTLNLDLLRASFEHGYDRHLNAKIYDLLKTQMNLRVYVTDTLGTVLFDSEGGTDEGKDYSHWNDVRKTLEGKYGARATSTVEGDENTTVLYVASPIVRNGDLLGVLSASKPVGSISLFVRQAKKNILTATLLILAGVFVLGTLLSSWVTLPIRRLTAYARQVQAGTPGVALPRTKGRYLGRTEIDEMGEAFEDMRETLEGKNYVEQYVQTLTHEIKSPVSAIRGAAELLDEDMPVNDRRRFLSNITRESDRIKDIIERLLQLSALENRKQLKNVENIDLNNLVREVVEDFRPVLTKNNLTVEMHESEFAELRGERFLLRQAVANLLQNAVEFSPKEAVIRIEIENQNGCPAVSVADTGPGIPSYARERVFERFYSLKRPGSNKKSSGLGLSFVKEVTLLHKGNITLRQNAPNGAVATLCFPAPDADTKSTGSS